jgi:hypothetical protein
MNRTRGPGGRWVRRRLLALLTAALSFGLAGAIGCASWVREGLDPATMPVEVRDDYALFAQRCSKCHSLARPLTSGIDDDRYWVYYVARMRRQPASGISEEDTVGILRFLHYFSVEEKRKNGKLPAEGATAVPSAPSVSPPPPASAAPPSSLPPTPPSSPPPAPPASVAPPPSPPAPSAQPTDGLSPAPGAPPGVTGRAARLPGGRL